MEDKLESSPYPFMYFNAVNVDIHNVMNDYAA